MVFLGLANMKKQLKKKKMITVVMALMLILVYIMIFSFSSDDAAASSTISVKVTKWLMKVYYKLSGSGGGNLLPVPGAIDGTEAIVRKMAHFAEYMAVGLLSFGIALMWIRGTAKGVMIVSLQLVVSAGFDELHQYFVPGRYSSLRDVMIDTAGGMTGVIMILIIKGLRKRWNHFQEPE